MKKYSSEDEATVRAQEGVATWAHAALITPDQRRVLDADLNGRLRRTNGYLRGLFFLLTAGTLVCATAGVADILFHGRDHGECLTILMVAVLSYGAAEWLISSQRLYRFGVEEALLMFSVVGLSIGLRGLFSVSFDPPTITSTFLRSVGPASGALGAFFIYYRFGYRYAFIAALTFLAWWSAEWSTTHMIQRLSLLGMYGGGLLILFIFKKSRVASSAGDNRTVSESFLWMAVYLATNLRLLSIVDDSAGGRFFLHGIGSRMPHWYYWTTYILIWFVPMIVLSRGILLKDHGLIRVGAITALLTLMTNKPYLGWSRYPWDPMILGAFLVGVAEFLRRWIAQTPNGVRRGFTIARIPGSDPKIMNALAMASGFLPARMTADASSPDHASYSGGSSGGGGASSSF